MVLMPQSPTPASISSGAGVLLLSPAPASVSCSCLNPLLLQVPEELLDSEPGKVTVADLVEKAEEEKVEALAAEEKAEGKGEEEEEVPAPVEDEDEAICTRDPKTQKAQVGQQLI